MTQILFLVATALGTITIFVALTIVVHKMRSDLDARRKMQQRRQLEPCIESYLEGQYPRLAEALGAEIRERDRAVIEDILLHRTHDAPGACRPRIIQAFEEIGLVDRCLEQLTKREWWLRAEAAENLGLARAGRAQGPLVEALKDNDEEVRFRAARALGRMGDPAAFPALLETLNQPERFSTIRMATVLIAIGPGVADAIMKGFTTLSATARIAALDVLAAVGSAELGRWIGERLKDDNADVRSRAVKGLGAVGDSSSGPLLVDALRDPEWPVRALAAKALAKLRYEAAVPKLCHSLRDSEWWVRNNAAEALRELGTQGLTGLESMIDDSDIYARHQAVFMLEESGVLDERVSGLFDPSNSRRTKSRSFVEHVIESGQCERLSDLSEEHDDLQIRSFLSDALQRNEVTPELRP